MPCDQLTPFLRAAKRATYAAQGDAASVPPLIAGANQLEFQEGDLRYQDLYVGMRRFVGQEIVFQREQPIWSMAYAGGVDDALPAAEANAVYAHLRSALLLAPEKLPLRGPSRHEVSQLSYVCQVSGHLASFHGHEVIRIGTSLAYELRFSGGLLR
jgi:hypothetical protein